MHIKDPWMSRYFFHTFLNVINSIINWFKDGLPLYLTLIKYTNIYLNPYWLEIRFFLEFYEPSVSKLCIFCHSVVAFDIFVHIFLFKIVSICRWIIFSSQPILILFVSLSQLLQLQAKCAWNVCFSCTIIVDSRMEAKIVST